MNANAAVDLSHARVIHLDNGLTLLVLEEKTFPVVSVQMAYKTGARDDPDGRMGLAHFFEHMAFRASKNFPGTGLVDHIYAAGGEWHGYTWIDHITFFATAPKENLGLLLRIEADRLGRLDMDKDVVKAEAGAVLAEMDGYENDPSSVLFDAVTAAAFQVHPYRKNTIGFEGDVGAITHADIVKFYRDMIRPGAAVLAVAGDVDADEVEASVRKLFGKFKGDAPPVMPPKSEPLFPVERRVRIEGATDEKLFKIAYPAPEASSRDFAAFLVLQELTGGGAGVSFLQNDWGTPVKDGKALSGVTGDLATWFIPTAHPYVFMVEGTADAGANEAKLESAIQSALDGLASHPVSGDKLEAARKAVRRELLYDLETTEDAAHQLAYFEAVGALDQLISLDDSVSAVTADDVMRVAQTYLDRRRRTIGWYVPESGKEAKPLHYGPAVLTETPARAGMADHSAPAADPVLTQMGENGLFAVEPSSFSSTVAVKAVLPGLYDCSLCAPNDPAPGYTSIEAKGVTGEFQRLVDETKSAVAEAKAAKGTGAKDSDDPATRVQQIFARRFMLSSNPGPAAPIFIAAAGDLDLQQAKEAISKAFPASAWASQKPDVRLAASSGDIDAAIPEEKAQTRLGYMVHAPATDDPKALPWRLALYMLTHDYGGRLGAEAISKRGLVYYIGSDYRTASDGGLIVISTGVHPAKQRAMRDLMKAELKRLIDEPPSDAELAQAKQHLIGRRISAAQSNEELVSAMAQTWLTDSGWSVEDFAKAVNAVTLDDVLAILPAFTGGDMVTISVGSTEMSE